MGVYVRRPKLARTFMKRIAIALAVTCLCLGCFGACGSSGSEPSGSGGSTGTTGTTGTTGSDTTSTDETSSSSGPDLVVSTDACTTDADCVPGGCCHPTSCVARGNAPACGDSVCTTDCRYGTLDCGGSCLCHEGHCAAQLSQPPNIPGVSDSVQ
jgi:hypothetical protein